MLIDGPTTNVKRQVISLRRVKLIDLLAPVQRGARSGSVRKVMDESDVVNKFQASTIGQKLAKLALRRNLTDFDRHKVMLAKMARAKILKST